MVIICAIVFIGTLYPLFIQFFLKQEISVGAPYFNIALAPITLFLLILAAFSPKLIWHVSNNKRTGRIGRLNNHQIELGESGNRGLYNGENSKNNNENSKEKRSRSEIHNQISSKIASKASGKTSYKASSKISSKKTAIKLSKGKLSWQGIIADHILLISLAVIFSLILYSIYSIFLYEYIVDDIFSLSYVIGFLITAFANILIFLVINLILKKLCLLRTSFMNSINQFRFIARSIYSLSFAHVGFALILIAIVFSSIFSIEEQKMMELGERVNIANLEIELTTPQYKRGQNYIARNMQFTVYKKLSSTELTNLIAETRFYPVKTQTTNEVALYSSFLYDLHISLGRLDPIEPKVFVRIYYKPLVWLIWIGTILLIIGIAIGIKNSKR